MLATYERLKQIGVTPYWRIHHGITLSLYYQDPDGNRMEFQVYCEERYARRESDATEVAAIYASLGNKDQAFAWLDKAFQDHSSLLVDARVEFPFASLRDDPRFRDLRKRMGMPE